MAIQGSGGIAKAVEAGVRQVAQMLPEANAWRRTTQPVSKLAVALQCCRRHQEAIRAFFDALALKLDEPTTHFRLGMSFKELGMKAEAAECVR